MRNSYYAAKRMFEKTKNNINKDRMQFAKKNYKKAVNQMKTQFRRQYQKKISTLNKPTLSYSGE